MKIDYVNLMRQNPTQLDEMNNSYGQLIKFYEHPTMGDDEPIIVVCDALELAFNSGFYDLDDMMGDHKEYEPIIKDEQLKFGYELN